MQRAELKKVLTHAYLVLFERLDGSDGFQRAFCESWEQADGKIEAEKRWLAWHRHTFIEAFIVDAQDISNKRKKKKGQVGGKRSPS